MNSFYEKFGNPSPFQTSIKNLKKYQKNKHKSLNKHKNVSLCVSGFGRKYNSYPTINELIETYFYQIFFTEKRKNMFGDYYRFHWFVRYDTPDMTVVQIPDKPKKNKQERGYVICICNFCGNRIWQPKDYYSKKIKNCSQRIRCVCHLDKNVRCPWRPDWDLTST